MKNNLKIVVLLNPNEGGCNYSDYIRKNLINNKTLHPVCYEPELDIIETSSKPMITLYDGEEVKMTMIGNQVNIEHLQKYLIKHYYKKQDGRSN